MDPLVAALPPQTDYITYLTILEYQLTPQNLPVLNRLLQEDDGTLAAEIGWDLLKLVLPILRVEPESARECLDIIARRGNPREVIVRVSEELERLGQRDYGGEDDLSEGEDGLPTFAGEAPRVHLGNMALHGMPPSSKVTQPTPQSETDDEPLDTAIEEVNLQALLSMLSILHPRIKTQYPSRFLATSLPAALGSYRRLSMNYKSTSTFLNTLTKLAGKKRPALPPRVSTSDVLNRAAPLPDPDSKKELQGTSLGSINEAEINERLLQAVLLEIVEEHAVASSEAQPPLTARLRAYFEPRTITSARRTDLEALTTNDEAKSADILRDTFVSVARDLKLDVVSAINKIYEPDAGDDDNDEEEHEYPTSPSQIPFSATGLLLIYSAQGFAQIKSSAQTVSTEPPLQPLAIQHVLQTIDKQYESNIRLRNSPPAIDSLLALLYTIFCIPKPRSSTFAVVSEAESQTLLLAISTLLTSIFINTPDPDLRDNAYHIASHIFHGYCHRTTRIKIIISLLARVASASSPATSTIHETHAANLKAITVDWVKDELFPTQTSQGMMQNLHPESERGSPISILNELADLIFPTESVPPVPEQSTDKATRQAATETVTSELPFYVASLNLLSLLAKRYNAATTSEITNVASTSTAPEAASSSPSNTTLTSASELKSAPSTSSTTTQASPPTTILSKAQTFLHALKPWQNYLTSSYTPAPVQGTGKNTTESGSETQAAADVEMEMEIEIDGISVTLPDLFAFEDAVGRAVEAFGLQETEE